MDTTVSGIGAVVVAELRAAGYLESTVGQYAKSIKALTEFASGREYVRRFGCGVRLDDDQRAHWSWA